MAIRVKTQKDFLKTEVTIDLPADVAQVNEVLKSSKASGKMVVLYYDGHVQGINVEQNAKIPSSKSEEIRKILDIDDKVL